MNQLDQQITELLAAAPDKTLSISQIAHELRTALNRPVEGVAFALQQLRDDGKVKMKAEHGRQFWILVPL